MLQPVLDLRATIGVPEVRAGLKTIIFSEKESSLKFLDRKTLLRSGHAYCNNYILMILRLFNHIECFTLIVISVQAYDDLAIDGSSMQFYSISEASNNFWEFQPRDIVLHIHHDLRIHYALRPCLSKISTESFLKIFSISQQKDCIVVSLEESVEVKWKYQVLYWTWYLDIMAEGQSLNHSHFQGTFQVNMEFSFRNLVTNLI